MKKHLLFLFTALLPLVASAEKVEIDGIWYNLVSKAKQAEVTYKGDSYDSYSGEYSGSITIPATATYEGVAYSVTSIENDAFRGCSSLTAITIPEDVTSIGDEAFYGCSGLTAITLPEGVTSIGNYAFKGCISLTSITLPEGVTSIGNSAFWNCSSLTSITLPEGVTSIGDYAFYGCSSLTSITIPKGVTSIGSSAFSSCSSLTSITLPEGVTIIGVEAFKGCSSLTAINIPEGVTSIGYRAFSGCSSLTTVVLPKSVDYIYTNAFANCPELTDVYCYAESVPSTTTDAFDGSYPEYATLHVPTSAINSYKGTAPWSGFGKFETTSIAVECITLSQSTATLLEGASLTLTATVAPDNATDKTLTWSSSNPSVATVDNMGKVTAIASGTATITATANDGSGVSAQCEVTVTRTAKVEIEGIWYNLVSKAKQAEVTYKGSSYNEYNEHSGSITIPATVTYDGVAYSVTSIGKNAFRDCSSLTAITIPEGVTSIGSGAFRDCPSLTAVHISSIEAWCKISFGDSHSNPLYYAHNLYLNGELVTELVIPEGVTSIGDRAFYGCSSLTTITIPEGVTSIGEYAFRDCSSLTAITLPEGVTSIEYAAFYNCSSLTAINIPESVTSIEDGAFFGCTSLTAITIPEGVTSIGTGTFSGCSSLKSITLPESVTSIGVQAFYGCSSLTAINIPEGVTGIEYEAFQGCSSLTAIMLPKSVKSIGSEAFANCSELTDVYCYAESVPNTEADAFDGSYPEYATLHVPAGALETYKSKAPWSSFGTIVSLTNEKVTSITLNHTEATLTEGKTLTLTATITPIYATDRSLTWSSSDSNVASVDDKGKVTAIAPGTATITAKANDGSGVSASCEVTVEAATYVSITINQYGSGTYCSEYALDFSNVEGLKAYAAAGYDTETGVVTLLRVMTAKAGVGLFIKGEPGEYRVPVIENTSYNSLNMLVGTLAKTTVNATSGDGLYANYKYTIKESDSQPLFYRFTDGSTLGAGKAYLQIPMAWLPQTSEAKSISLRFEEGEGTTDIENSEIKKQNSEFVYDLYGRRVDNPVKGGIYIVGGKKKVVK